MNLILNSSDLGISNGELIQISEHGEIKYGSNTYVAPKLKIKFEEDRVNNFYTNEQLVAFAVHVFKNLYKCGEVIELVSDDSGISVFKTIGGSSRHQENRIYIHNGPNPLEFVHEIIHCLLGENDFGNASHINEIGQNLGPLSTFFCASFNVFSESVPGYLFDLNTHLQIHGIDSSILDIRPFHYLFPVYANDMISRSSIYPEVQTFCTELFKRESNNKEEINTELAALLLMLFFARINHNHDSTNKSTYKSPIMNPGGNITVDIQEEEKTELKEENYESKKDSESLLNKIDAESKLLNGFLTAKFKDEYRLYKDFPKFYITKSFENEQIFIGKNIKFIKSRIVDNATEFLKLNFKEKIGLYTQLIKKAKNISVNKK